MKKIIVLSIAFLSTIIVNAQKFDEAAVAELADKVCECLQTKGTIETQEKAELQLGSCMLTSYSKNKKYFDEKGVNFLEGNNAEELGEEVGIQLVANCPESIPIFMLFADDEEYMEEDENIVFTGKIVKIDDNKFNTFEIKDENGRKRKVVWLTYVDNGELLEDAIKGKKEYIFTAMELEIYDPRIEEYRNMLILDRINKK